MQFSFSEAQKSWYETALDFARRHLADPDADRRERAAEFWHEGFLECAKLGIQGLTIPKILGGQGLDMSTAAAAMEGLGYGCSDSGLLFAINAALWTVTMPIDRFGTDAQKERYLPSLCSGRLIGANAASEPDAGSDIFSMTTRAEKHERGWMLSGRKIWITAGPIADLFLCFATTDPSKAALGISAFLVPRDTPGFRVVREIPKLGMRTVPMGELIFENCLLPEHSLLGRLGRGMQIFNASLEWERGCILATAVGTMRRQLDRCIARAQARKQFGQPIGKFQSVSNRIVDMAVRLETSRLMIYRYAFLESTGQNTTAAASMAKLHVSESFLQNSMDAIRIFGAEGYTLEGGVERDLRDSVGSVIFSGTNDIQRNIIARTLRIG
jgi:alkylation response protein AidB-like acyl-CoA dehydrogenase